jgi:hypothetical protein
MSEPKPDPAPQRPPASTHAEQAAKRHPDLSDEEKRRLAEQASREEDA